MNDAPQKPGEDAPVVAGARPYSAFRALPPGPTTWRHGDERGSGHTEQRARMTLRPAIAPRPIGISLASGCFRGPMKLDAASIAPAWGTPARVIVEDARDRGLLVARSRSAARIRFPGAPAAPGIYRFDLGDRVYIGETSQLKRRFQGYRTPGASQATNIRLNSGLTALLQSGRAATAASVTTAVVDVDGMRVPLDLSYKPARLLVESAALVAERLRGRPVENL